jgi:2-polyprenyl-3-methyl-5-hydroxy-6-metoxy-1,4-benzoquinol methylase
MMRSKKYLLQSAIKCALSIGYACPSCGCQQSAVVDRKWLVTTLRRCEGCRLLFRAPTIPVEKAKKTYQIEYEEGFTTDCPDENTLAELKSHSFRGSDRDYGKYLRVLDGLNIDRKSRVYDFGCSWGYGSYQLAAAGFGVDAFEISAPRARYANEKLGVNLVTPDLAPSGCYDVFFSAHVIEHVPSVSDLFNQAFRVLKPGGLMVTFTPNGGDVFRSADYNSWHRMWGYVHPQLIDEEYLTRRFPHGSLFIGPSDVSVERLEEFNRTGRVVIPNNCVELLFVVQRPDAS